MISASNGNGMYAGCDANARTAQQRARKERAEGT